MLPLGENGKSNNTFHLSVSFLLTVCKSTIISKKKVYLKKIHCWLLTASESGFYNSLLFSVYNLKIFDTNSIYFQYAQY